MHIDVHCHMFPDEYIDLVEKEGGRYGAVIHTGGDGERYCTLKGARQPPLKPFMDTGVRLGTMDEMGLDMNVLSFSSRPGVYWADAGLAEELSREANNGYARMIKERPEKFSGLATLPAQDGERSARELERSVNELGLKGGRHYLVEAWLCGDEGKLHLNDVPKVWTWKTTAWLAAIATLGIPLGFLMASLVNAWR